MENELKRQIVSIKVDAELASFLDALPNKSEFIRNAILAQCVASCPLCYGTGVVFRGIGEHFAKVLTDCRHVSCKKCSKVEKIPSREQQMDTPPWVQFLQGGPFLCAKCYRAGMDSEGET